MNPQMAALQEAARQRFGGAGQSMVGMSQNPSASNPLQSRMGMQQSPAQAMNGGAISAMNQAQPNEAQLILKSLIKRLHDNQPENPRPPKTGV